MLHSYTTCYVPVTILAKHLTGISSFSPYENRQGSYKQHPHFIGDQERFGNQLDVTQEVSEPGGDPGNLALKFVYLAPARFG